MQIPGVLRIIFKYCNTVGCGHPDLAEFFAFSNCSLLLFILLVFILISKRELPLCIFQLKLEVQRGIMGHYGPRITSRHTLCLCNTIQTSI